MDAGVGKSEVDLRNLQKVSWWRKVSQGDVHATEGQLAQQPGGLVKSGDFNLTTMASHCRVLDRRYGMVPFVFKRIALASVQPITLETSYLLQSPHSYIATVLASFAYRFIFALCVFPTLREPPEELLGKICRRKYNTTNNGHCHRVCSACL